MAIRVLEKHGAILSVCAGILTGILGITILFKDLILAGTFDVLWADNFDSRLEYWIANWGYHILFEQRQPLGFWNANSFFPNNSTLAYSDSLLGMQLLFSPLRILGFTPLASLYMTLAGVCIIGVMLTQHALYRLGCFSLVERILIAFAAHFGLSMISFFNHYQLFGFQLASPFFLFLYLYLQEWKKRDLMVLVSLFAVGVSFAMYLAPMLFILSLSMCVPIVLKQIKHFGILDVLKKVGVRGAGVVAAGILVLYSVQMRPYFEIVDAFPKQSFEETAIYSANLHSIFTGLSKFSLWYGPAEYPVYGSWEYAYFPGFVLLVLGGLYLLWSVGVALTGRFILGKENTRSKQLQQARQGESIPIPGDLILYMAILFLSAIVLSWGPYHKSDHSIQFPFYFLSKISFGLRDIRAPGRFGMFIALPLATFTVAFLRGVVTSRRTRHWATLFVTLAIVVESFPSFPVYPFSIDSNGVYRRVCQAIEPGTPLLELPVLGKEHFETIQIAMEQLDGSTIHWGKLMVGYGAKTTSEYTALLNIDHKIQEELASPKTAIRFGRRYGISHVLVHLNRYPPAVAQTWRKIAHELDGQIYFETKDAIFFSLENGQAGNFTGLTSRSCEPRVGPDKD